MGISFLRLMFNHVNHFALSLKVIRGNSVVTVEALEPISRTLWLVFSSINDLMVYYCKNCYSGVGDLKLQGKLWIWRFSMYFDSIPNGKTSYKVFDNFTNVLVKLMLHAAANSLVVFALFLLAHGKDICAIPDSLLCNPSMFLSN